jgi:hypothetical protein
MTADRYVATIFCCKCAKPCPPGRWEYRPVGFASMPVCDGCHAAPVLTDWLEVDAT